MQPVCPDCSERNLCDYYDPKEDGLGNTIFEAVCKSCGYQWIWAKDRKEVALGISKLVENALDAASDASWNAEDIVKRIDDVVADLKAIRQKLPKEKK